MELRSHIPAPRSPAVPAHGGRQLHWTGNAAKARVIDRILADQRPSVTVFDYGAGRGGDWPLVLAQRPDLELICYEPDPTAAADLARALAGQPARVLSGAQFERADLGADYIVSFSVLEHVVDRAAYLGHAKRQLAADGTFFLNYDDGHFRTALDLDELRGWRASLAVALQNRLAWAWPRLGKWQRYQARVSSASIAGLVHAAGFVKVEDRYENLETFKMLAKTMPDDRRQDFARYWLDVEATLNARFRSEGEERMGDRVNLWLGMASRTLALKHA